MVVHGIPDQDAAAARRRALDRRRRDQGRLGRRRGDDGADRGDLGGGREAARGDQGLAPHRDRPGPPGNHLGDIGARVRATSRPRGLSVIRTLVGHGIGREMHEEPQVPNFGEPGRGPGAGRGDGAGDRADGQRRRPAGADGRRRLGGLLRDDSLAAHFEFTVAITPEGPRVLTPWHEA